MKTAVSVPDELFKQADRLARTSNRSRSDVYSAALREYLARHQPDEVTAALDGVINDVGVSGEAAFVARAARRTLSRADW